MPHRSLPALVCALVFAAAAAVEARQDEPPAGVARTGQVVPQLLLGRRVEHLRQNLPVNPTVVLVGDAAGFVRLISRWSPSERFPILIDDGSDAAMEEIARFVRAFEPARVVRWRPPAEGPESAPLPREPGAFREAVERAAGLSWGARTAEERRAEWERLGFVPFGVVAASHEDPAWAGALALAAGRGQPIVWVSSRPAPMGNITARSNVEALSREIERGLERLGYSWRGQGDDIDALTLCLTTQTRVNLDNELRALTDIIGRGANGQRWAWAGLLHGSERESVYRAMCALFLTPGRAWLFDGYASGFAPPYQVAPAAKILSDAGLDVSTNSAPHSGLTHWRARSRFGVPFDFIHVNSSGNSGWFDLTPGRAYASEVPLLKRPAVVHFIHSFSAQAPDNGSTVAGRWLEAGAYAYYGSMDEPFLGAFVPAQAVAARWIGGAPLVCAVRQEGERVWKLNYLGDPLITHGPPAPRVEGAPALEGAAGLEEEMRAAVRGSRLGEAARALVMMGRDGDAARLASAALRTDPEGVPPGLARAALTAAFREQDGGLFLDLYARMTPEAQREPLLADLLWQAARGELPTTTDHRLLGIMRMTIRNASMVEDAAELAPALKRVFGPEAARSMYGSLLERAADDGTRSKLREAGGRH